MYLGKIVSLISCCALLSECNYHDISVTKPIVAWQQEVTKVKKDTTGKKQDTTKATPDNTPINPVANNLGDNPNIYLAGFLSQAALCWKNGAADTLAKDAVALSMYVDGTDIYVAGWTWINNTHVATYWKNGVKVLLADTSKNTYAQSIIVSQKSVYVVGLEMQKNYGSPIVAKCWKDGMSLPLSVANAEGSVAVAACISGSDVYVAGWVWRSNNMGIATYWKNGIPVFLTDGSSASMAESIFAYGDDVYVAGTINFPITNMFPPRYIQAMGKGGVATCWRNGKPTTLSNTGRATSIVVSGTDVYVAGSVYSTDITGLTPGGPINGDLAVYWKNGVAVSLNDDKSYSQANSISVTRNGDVYLAGHINNFPVYWKNGAPTYVPVKYNGYLYSIVLTN